VPPQYLCKTLEPAYAARMKLSKLFWIGVAVAVASVAPLLLYVIFGPANGNPIGLGLLFFFGTPVGLVLTVLGLATSRRR